MCGPIAEPIHATGAFAMASRLGSHHGASRAIRGGVYKASSRVVHSAMAYIALVV